MCILRDIMHIPFHCGEEQLLLWWISIKDVVSQPFCLSHCPLLSLVVISFLSKLTHNQKVFGTLHAAGQPTCWAVQPNALKMWTKSTHYKNDISHFTSDLLLLVASAIFKRILCLSAKNSEGVQHLFLNVVGHLGIINFICFCKKLKDIFCMLSVGREDKWKVLFIKF